MKQINIINSNIKIQKSAYKLADIRSKAFIIGEIKDGKTTEEWKEYRKVKSELNNIIDKELKNFYSQTRKECYDEMREMIKSNKKEILYGEDRKGLEDSTYKYPVFAVITWKADDGVEQTDVTTVMENYELTREITRFISCTLKGRDATSQIYDARIFKWSDIKEEYGEKKGYPTNLEDVGFNVCLDEILKQLDEKEGK